MRFEEKTDEDLFTLLRHKKRSIAEKAFQELYQRYATQVYNYCWTILRDKQDTEDAFQETFLKFYRSAQSERDMTNVPAFLFRIARNTCINIKKMRARAMDSFDETFMHPTSEKKYEKNELLQLIDTAVKLLPDDLREIFLLREYYGYSYAEIATIVHISEEAARVRAFRARRQVQKILAPYINEFQTEFKQASIKSNE